MSRRLVIIILSVLIIGVIGGTVTLISARLRSGTQPAPTAPGPGDLSQAPGIGRPLTDCEEQALLDPTGDIDGDGLSNADELLWGTDPCNPDTDGDGFLDGEEVAAGYNPTIPAPNDKLPEGFIPGRDRTPLDVAPAQPIAVDQFFVSNLSLEIAPGRNLTEEYNKEYPEGQRSEATLDDFVYSQPIVTQLPRPLDRVLNILPANSGSIVEYLEQIGDTHVLYDPATFRRALDMLLINNDAASIQSLAIQAQVYQQMLLRTSVPAEAANLHKLLLGYGEFAAVVYNQIGQQAADPVKAIVAIRQLEESAALYMPLIEQEIDRLIASP